MRILIDGKEFTNKEMDDWKKIRIKKVLRNLKYNNTNSEDIKYLDDTLINLKIKFTYEEMISLLKRKLVISECAMRIASHLSMNKRKKAITFIYADGIDADTFSIKINALMLEPNKEYEKVNLSACPDHYVLKPHDGILEVIETAGNSPLPTQFFICFEDESGIQEPRDTHYSHQSTGIAKLKDGTIIGGVRHQFRDTASGIEARLLVEFPALCPNFLIKQHQRHLAVEWSSWISWIKLNLNE